MPQFRQSIAPVISYNTSETVTGRCNYTAWHVLSVRFRKSGGEHASAKFMTGQIVSELYWKYYELFTAVRAISLWDISGWPRCYVWGKYNWNSYRDYISYHAIYVAVTLITTVYLWESWLVIAWSVLTWYCRKQGSTRCKGYMWITYHHYTRSKWYIYMWIPTHHPRHTRTHHARAPHHSSSRARYESDEDILMANDRVITGLHLLHSTLLYLALILRRSFAHLSSLVCNYLLWEACGK